MRGFGWIGLTLSLGISTLCGCGEEESPLPRKDLQRDGGGGVVSDVDRDAGAARPDAGAAEDAGVAEDAGRNGEAPRDAAAPAPLERPDAGAPPVLAARRTEVPDELVGAWESGSIDFELWENYKEGYWAGRSAIPTREAMIFAENGDAEFYRYEFAFGVYEELIECQGTVAFDDDGTFTFYPLAGHKRFFYARHSEDNVDRALTDEELLSPELAGKRAYAYQPEADTIQITVPGSAPYNWYRKE